MKLTQQFLWSVLAYDGATGVFTWVASPSQYTNGRVAGSIDEYGYRRISIAGHFHKAHRLAWFSVHGRWPEGEIEHINGVRDDNRIDNLRVATRAMNTQNTRVRRDNKAGLAGASFYSPTGKWKAQIKASGKTLHLGYFDNARDAHEAYMAAKVKHHAGFVIRDGIGITAKPQQKENKE